MSRVAGVRVDWQRVFEDFTFLEMSVQEVAARVGLRAPLLERIGAGRAQPPSNAADRLASLWSHLTSKPLEFLPRSGRDELAPQCTADEEPRPCFIPLQQVIASWRR